MIQQIGSFGHGGGHDPNLPGNLPSILPVKID